MFVEGNIRTRGKTKLTTVSLEGPYVKCFAIYLDFPLNKIQQKTNKQTKTAQLAHGTTGAQAATAQLHPGRDTF